MKLFFKENKIFIIIISLFFITTQWFLWSSVFVLYNSPADFIQNKSDSVYLTEIIAQDEQYTVCFSTSYYSDKPNKQYILEKTKNGVWKELSEGLDYKEKFYISMNNENDFSYIYFFGLKNNKNIIIVEKNVFSIKSGEYIFEKNDTKFTKIKDSQSTEFHYSAIPDKRIALLNILYIGFVDDFDKNTYTLYINDKEYPFKDWKRLLK